MYTGLSLGAVIEMEEWEPKYKCSDCNDSGFVWTVRADGTREMVMCHCHPLVKKGKAKPWDGDSAIRRAIKKKGNYNIRG